MFRLLTIPACLSLLVLLAGCGGSGNTQVSSASNSASSTGGPPPPPAAGPPAGGAPQQQAASNGGSDEEATTEEEGGGSVRGPMGMGAAGAGGARSPMGMGAAGAGGARSPMGMGAAGAGGGEHGSSGGGGRGEHASGGSSEYPGGAGGSAEGGAGEHETFSEEGMVEENDNGSASDGGVDGEGEGEGEGEVGSAEMGFGGRGRMANNSQNTEPPPPPEPLTLREKAEEAIRVGDEKRAFDYLFASALADDDSDVLKQYGWSPALRRPVPAVRFGLGVDVTISPKQYEGSLFPLGSEQAIPDRASRRQRTSRTTRGSRGGYGGERSGGSERSGGGYGGEESGSGGEGYGGEMGPPGAGRGRGGNNADQVSARDLQEAAGDLADSFLNGLREKIDKGEFGQLLVQLAEAKTRPSRRNVARTSNRPGNRSETSGGRAGGFGGGGAPPSAGAGLPPGESGAPPSSGAGLPPGEAGLPPGGGGARRGGGGNEEESFSEGGGSEEEEGYSGRGYGAGGRGNQQAAAGDPASVAPGIFVLGKGSSNKLLDEALEQGIDILVLFESEVKQNLKTGLVNNGTKIVVWDVRRRENMFRTKSLDNIAVQKLRADEDAEEDPVEAVIEKLLEDFETKDGSVLTLGKLPEGINADNVQGRVKMLLDSEDTAQLPTLAEIKFYHSKGLLDDATLTKCFQQLLGDLDGAKLAEGKEEERLEAVEHLLPSE